MWVVLIGGILVGLPAIVVVGYYVGSVMMFPALVSLIIAAIPFIVFWYVLKDGDEEDGDAVF